MAEPIDEHFTATVAAMNSSPRRRADDEPVRDGSALTTRVCLALYDVALGSRHLDLAARWLRSQGRGYYTIGSSGHEGNAAVAAALRPTDPALLHYRSGAFFLARAALVDGREPLRDVLLGLVAATDEPISGGRHKVFGRHDLNIIPQTSTIDQRPRDRGQRHPPDAAARQLLEGHRQSGVLGTLRDCSQAADGPALEYIA